MENASPILLFISLSLSVLLFRCVSVECLGVVRNDANSLRTSKLRIDLTVLSRWCQERKHSGSRTFCSQTKLETVYVRIAHLVLHISFNTNEWIADPAETVVPVLSQHSIVMDFCADKETDSRSVPSIKSYFSIVAVNLAFFFQAHSILAGPLQTTRPITMTW